MRIVAHVQKRNPLSDLHKILHGRRYPDVITRAHFGYDQLDGSFGGGDQSVPLHIGFHRRPYNTLALSWECVIGKTGVRKVR